MACLTLVYVTAALCLVGLGLRQFKQTAELERNRARPYVIFDLSFERWNWFASLTNIGQTAAYKVSVQIAPKLETCGPESMPYDRQLKTIPFIEHGIPMLAPRRELKALIGLWHRVDKAYPTQQFKGIVSYRSIDDWIYSEPFAIDMAATKVLFSRSAKDIEDVAKQLEEMTKVISSVASAMSARSSNQAADA